MIYVIVGTIGLLLGRVAAGWSAAMLVGMNTGGLGSCSKCQKPVSTGARWTKLTPIQCECGQTSGWWPMLSSIGLSLTFIVFTWLLVGPFNCQGLHEVRPESSLVLSRLPFHLSLIFLLWVSLITDLLDYVIPDEIIYTGMAIALLSAGFSGELQIIHIWVNWDEALVSINGPYLPQWMKDHHHLHGIAWSLAGATAGATITWLIRWLSASILGHPALGLGDVTLMTMIGAYVGWQPTLCILAIAPLTGIVIGIVVRLFSGRSFVAYGPYLVCSTIIVLSTWRWIWQPPGDLRIIFSHWPSIAGLVGFALAVLCILLLILRIMKAVPASTLRR